MKEKQKILETTLLLILPIKTYLIIQNNTKQLKIPAKHFTKQILQVVNYLHINNICHCDLKHENFLCFNVSNEDYFENVSLKLIDFEFSKYTHNNIGKRKRLIGRSGTISFMAP